MVSQTVQAKYWEWTHDPYFSKETREELLRLQDPKEIEDRFYCDLEFGTGGMRGILGAGTNRMNIYMIRRLAQGLADVITTEGTTEKGLRSPMIPAAFPRNLHWKPPWS